MLNGTACYQEKRSKRMRIHKHKLSVISQPSTQKHRQIYRETVLSPITNQCLTDIKYAFVIGRVDNDEMQNRLDKESEEHGDILQGNFTDSYENLTIKSIFLVRWTALKCPQAKFLLKLDDDVFTILDDVRYFFKHETLASYSISGSVFKNAKPVRDPTNKWHAGDYTGTIYPTYVSGTAYIISSDLLKPISIVAMKVPFLRLEDIFITGLSAAATNLSVQYYQVPGFSYVPRAIGAVDFHYTKSIHGVNSAQLKTLHNRLKRERIGSCV
ncbi:beta-1,3-galactosyltransferase 5-like isoform X2 [Watersipora subatra]|uniref:beta-1,3-galactosyltransferase 5-like isoform X2 n=1 Tax=Watersipora subatra TaxID=2589382 RepID=UPI00355B2C78